MRHEGMNDVTYKTGGQGQQKISITAMDERRMAANFAKLPEPARRRPRADSGVAADALSLNGGLLWMS
jgi:hypothetical protein